MAQPAERFEFGQFEVNIREGLLLYQGQSVILTAKAFDTLAALVRSGGAMLTKAELMEQVWPGSFVEESNLVQNISMIRRALAIDPAGRDYIETVPKRGYRFRAEVHPAAPAPVAPVAPVAPIAYRRRWHVAAIAAAATVLFAAAFTLPKLTRARPRPSIAVLGFQNLSGNASFAWYGRALAELLATELDADGKLRTLPGEETARMRADLALPEQVGFSVETLQRIRQRTGSDYVITGSCLPQGDRIRVAVRIQNTITGETAGGFAITGTEARLAEVASEASAGIRAKLGFQPLTASAEALARESLPPTVESRQLYADGLERLRALDAVAAQPLLTRVVAAAPSFALGHMHLSAAWSLLGFDDLAVREAKAAFELSANLPRAERLEVEALYRLAGGEWPRAIDLYRSLWTFYPDQPQYGIALASAQTAGGKSQTAALTIAQLRLKPAPGLDAAISVAAGEAATARGEFALAAREFEDAIVRAHKQGARLLEGHAKAQQAWAYERVGDLEKAGAAWRESETICTAAGDTGCVAAALNAGAEQAQRRHDAKAARELTARAVAIERKNGDRKRLVTALRTLGNLEYAESNFAASRAAYTEALAAAREIGSAARVALILTHLGNLDRRTGHEESARKQFREGAALTTDTEGPRERAIRLDNEARTQARDGDLAGARRLYEEALTVKRGNASPTSYLYSMRLLSKVIEHQGDLKELRKLRVEECRLSREENAPRSAVWHCQIDSAHLDLLEGSAQAAWTAAVPLVESAATPALRLYVQRVVATSLLALGRAEEAAVEAGKALDTCGGDRPPDAIECLQISILSARIENAQGHAAVAGQRADAALRDATANKIVAYILDARLVKAEIAWRAHDPAAVAQSTALARDADRMGFRPIATAARAVKSASRPTTNR